VSKKILMISGLIACFSGIPILAAGATGWAMSGNPDWAVDGLISSFFISAYGVMAVLWCQK